MSIFATTRAHSHKHIAFFYNTKEERLQAISRYLQDGLSKGELCVYAAADSPVQVARDLKSAGIDTDSAMDSGALRILEMTETYLPNGDFSSEDMIGKLNELVQDASGHGFSGLRTAGEMRWLNTRPSSCTEAFIYEEKINQLCANDPSFTGLCMYPVHPDLTTVLNSALRSHPSFMYNNVVRGNPDFNFTVPAEVKATSSFESIKSILAAAA